MKLNKKIIGVGSAFAGSAVLATTLVGGGALGAFTPTIVNQGQGSVALTPVFEQYEGAGLDLDGDGVEGGLLATSSVVAGEANSFTTSSLGLLPVKMAPSEEATATFVFRNGLANDADVAGEDSVLTVEILESGATAEDVEALKLVNVKAEILDGNGDVVGTPIYEGTLDAVIAAQAVTPSVVTGDFAPDGEVTVKFTAAHNGSGVADEIGRVINSLDFKFVATTK